MLVPVVVEKEGNSERSFDIFSRLLRDRVVMVHGPIVEGSGALITSQLLFLDYENNNPIQMFINSPGGIVSEGMAIYDVMNYIKSPIHTYVMGMAASMGSFLASGGKKGYRYMLPHARQMVHQPSGGYQGQATDIMIHAKETERVKEELVKAYVLHTGQTYEKIYQDLERDKFLNAQECIDYGLADKIVKQK